MNQRFFSLRQGMTLLVLAFASVLPFASCSEEAVPAELRFNESTLPYRGGLLVANFGTETLNPLNDEGKGYIAWIRDGRTELAVPADGSLSAPKGMYVHGSRLFVCDVNRIVRFDLDRPVNERKGTAIVLPEGELFVNDLAAVGNDLYVSVTNTGNIYRMDISDPDAPGAPELWLNVPGANGLLTDGREMFVASYPPDGVTTERNVVYRIADLSAPEAVPFYAVPGQYDGLAYATDGKSVYVTNWTPAQVLRIDRRTAEAEVLPAPVELAGPADLSVLDGEVCVPDLPASRVVRIPENA